MLSRLFTLHSGYCQDEIVQLKAIIRDLRETNADLARQLKDMSGQNLIHLREIEESKAVFNYTVAELERDKKDLLEKLDSFIAIEEQKPGKGRYGRNVSRANGKRAKSDATDD